MSSRQFQFKPYKCVPWVSKNHGCCSFGGWSYSKATFGLLYAVIIMSWKVSLSDAIVIIKPEMHACWFRPETQASRRPGSSRSGNKEAQHNSSAWGLTGPFELCQSVRGAHGARWAAFQALQQCISIKFGSQVPQWPPTGVVGRSCPLMHVVTTFHAYSVRTQRIWMRATTWHNCWDTSFTWKIKALHVSAGPVISAYCRVASWAFILI